MWADFCFLVLLLMYNDYFILYKVLVGILHEDLGKTRGLGPTVIPP
jgi:hypothetical protein